MLDIREAFAQALKDMRHRAALAQTDFPPVVSREHISLLERGLRAPTLEAIDDLAKVLGISPLALVLQCYLLRDPTTSFEELIGEAVKQVRFDRIENAAKHPKS
ncbi:helix-turn-helix domain-containing protein [Pseudomonas sp. NMI4491_12]|uniref:helix-turn-helix domain-containing protein n=1 Tax=Pseudomonas sp. NMI4491_12 TaxID=2903146 RepID=UPI001E59C5E5|nr:helix-turn-helix domain-containing protein [Pseudomonas sp. NMI4491_12]